MYLLMINAANNLTLMDGGSQSGYSGRKMYVANMRQDAAMQTGQMTTKLIHIAMNAGKSPNALRIYVYSPPDSGIHAPSSAKHNAQRAENSPHTAHITIDIPTDLTLSKMPTGETNIPDPIIIPTIIHTAWNKLICFLSLIVVTTSSSPLLVNNSFSLHGSPDSVFKLSPDNRFTTPLDFLLDKELPFDTGEELSSTFPPRSPYVASIVSVLQI